MANTKDRIPGRYFFLFIVLVALGNNGALFAQDQECKITITGIPVNIDTTVDLCIVKGESVTEITSMFIEETIDDLILAGDTELTITGNQIVCILKLIEGGEVNESVVWTDAGEYYVLFGYAPDIYISKSKMNITAGNSIIPFSEFILMEFEE